MTVPNLNPYRTYQIVAPISTHFRPATCEEVDCDAYRHGWKTLVPSNSDQALYIRSGASGRRFIEVNDSCDETIGMTEFIFEAGQRCFGASKHVVPLERDPIFNVRENGLTRRHTRPELWTEDFAGHLDKVRRIKEG